MGRLADYEAVRCNSASGSPPFPPPTLNFFALLILLITRIVAVGVVALCKGHAEQCQKAEQLRGELTDLKRFEEGHKAALADLQREARTNRCYYADIQVTQERGIFPRYPVARIGAYVAYDRSACRTRRKPA